MTFKTASFLFLFAVLSMAAALFWNSFFLPKFQWDPVGMAYWPRVLIGAIAVLAVAIYLEWNNFDDDEEPAEIGFANFGLIAMGLIYAALLPKLGFWVLTPLFLALLTWGWSSQATKVWHIVAVSAAGVVIITAVFEIGLNFPLPKISVLGDD